MDLMSADRQKIYIERSGTDQNLSVRLNGINMKNDVLICGFYDIAGFLNGLYRTDLIINKHKRYQNGLGSYSFF